MIWVYVDNMKLSQHGISCDSLERTRKLYEMLKVTMETLHLEFSVTESGKEGEQVGGLQSLRHKLKGLSLY